MSGANNVNPNPFEEKLKSIVTEILNKEQKNAPASPPTGSSSNASPGAGSGAGSAPTGTGSAPTGTGSAPTGTGSAPGSGSSNTSPVVNPPVTVTGTGAGAGAGANNTSGGFSSVTNDSEFKNEINKFVEQIFKNISDEMTSLNIRNRVPNKTNIDYIMDNITDIKRLIDKLNKENNEAINEQKKLPNTYITELTTLKDTIENLLIDIIVEKYETNYQINKNSNNNVRNELELELKNEWDKVINTNNDEKNKLNEIKNHLNKLVSQIQDQLTEHTTNIEHNKSKIKETDIRKLNLSINEFKKSADDINKELQKYDNKIKDLDIVPPIFTIKVNDAIKIGFNAIMEKYKIINTNKMYIDITDTVITQDGCINDVICDIQDYYNSITLNLSELFNLPPNNPPVPVSDEEKKILKVLRKEITNFYSNIINNKYRVGWFGKRMASRFTEKFKVLTSQPQKKTSKIKMKISKYHIRKDRDGKPIMQPTKVIYESKNASKLMDIDEQLYRIKKKGKGNPIKDGPKEIIEIDS
jgi:hypothetical protein